MNTNLNYIYNIKGNPEYVVVPIALWNKLSLGNPKKTAPDNTIATKEFNPIDYYGAISHLDIDVEDELKKMRSEWDRTF